MESLLFLLLFLMLNSHEETVGSGVGEAYEDISTVVLNILQAEIGPAPAAEEG
jgi:hypothetical protein